MSDNKTLFEAFTASTFGELNAADYDEANDPGTTSQCVDLVAEIAGDGTRILEFASGSGRITIPLAERGFVIEGIEGSAEMVDLMRVKSGGETIPVAVGDMATTRVDGEFDHVFLVFNTIYNLTSQEAQIACFQNAARHLKPGGTFLVETFIPDLSALTNHQSVRTMRMDMGSVWIETLKHDPLAQRFDMQRIRFTNEGFKLVPLTMRYALPPELDLMAKLAGLELKQRWGGWDKQPFTADSKMHISVWQKR